MRILAVRPIAIASVALAACASSACGGGGGGGGGVTTLTFAPSTDLTLDSDGSTGGNGLAVGDTAANLGLRSGLRFGLFPFLPANATVISAKLHLRQRNVVGAPYTAFSSVVVDRVDFGLVLNDADFAPTILTAAIGTISSDATLGVKELDVTAAVAADVAAQALTSDFLLRVAPVTNSDSNADFVQFEDQENHLGSGDTPTLVVQYR